MGQNLQYDNEIKDIIQKYPTSYIKMLRSTGYDSRYIDRTYLIDYILQQTKILDDSRFNYSLKTRIWWIINNIKDWSDQKVCCKVCGNPIQNWNISKITLPYKDTCCKKCKYTYSKLKNEQTLQEKYGVKNPFQIPAIINNLKSRKNELENKRNITHRKNNSFNTSKPEEQAYNILLSTFKTVYRNYKSEKYPFKCDFYLPTCDTYIELNISWTHGGCIYDNTNEKCILQLKTWEEKSKNSKYYRNALETWTKRDPKKRQYALKNKLNYLEFWTLAQLESWATQKTSNLDNLEIKLDYNKLIAEFEYFRTHKANFFPKGPSSYNNIIKYFQQDVFYKQEKELWKNQIIRKRLLENRCKYLNTTIDKLSTLNILDGFKKSGIFYGYSHFNPLLLTWFVKKYNCLSLYDPCGGWGHRLLGSQELNQYIYNDLSPTTKHNVDRIIEFFNISNTRTYCCDARTFVPSEDFDSMFTCPPYFNLEQYECGIFKNEEDFREFLDNLFEIFYNKSTCKIFGLVIREDMLYTHTNFTEKYQVSVSREKYLTKNRLTSKSEEFLFIFQKSK